MSAGLALEGITRRYGDLVAVDSLSLAVTPGRLLALLGPNGAGKTTAISIISGLLAPDAGRLLWDGRPVDVRALRRRVGMCPQTAEVWPRLTCAEQLRFLGRLYGHPRRAAAMRAGELLDAVGLTEKCDTQARRLSGGMRQRLNLAMALVDDPPLLVLDEPTAGLDPQSRVLVRDLIARLARDRVVLLTSHNMDEVDRLADEVAVIDRGRLLDLGPPEDLKRRHGAVDLESVFLALTGRGLRE